MLGEREVRGTWRKRRRKMLRKIGTDIEADRKKIEAV